MPKSFQTPPAAVVKNLKQPTVFCFNVGNTDENLRTETFEIYQKIVGVEAEIESHLNLLKACKNANFIKKATQIIKNQINFLRTEIIL